ncbi:hypothetical protein BGW80DRAFT_1442298 [Lactifluus volemus]|nr:hypothetical protein BGW80DRAFT_1442298 [Lactifluus volemus]
MNHSPSSFRPHVISRAPGNDLLVIKDKTEDLLITVIVPAMSETFFFGLYTALFAFSTFITLRKGLPNRTRYALLAMSVVMYSVSAIHWALTFATAIRTLRIGKSPPRSRSDSCHVFTIDQCVDLSAHKFILSDGIVLWRAWILWDRRVVLFIVPFLSLVCTLVGTNLWATSFMFIRAWQHRRFLRSVFDKENAKSKAEKTLAFLVESGAIYLCIWVTYITMLACRISWVAVLDTNLVQIVGIYPTAIVVVITMRMSATDILSRPGGESRPYSTPIVFIPRSPTSQISEAGSNYSDIENGRKTTTRQDL